MSKVQLHTGRDEVLEDLSHRFAPGRHVARRIGHRCARLEERHQTFDVACIHSLHKEAFEVLGLTGTNVSTRIGQSSVVKSSGSIM